MSKVKELRLKRKLSQVELAKMADVSQGLISSIEGGKVASLRTLKKIADILKVKASTLINE